MKNKMYNIFFALIGIINITLLIYIICLINKSLVFYDLTSYLITIAIFIITFIMAVIYIIKNKKIIITKRDFIMPILNIIFIIVGVICVLIYNYKGLVFNNIHYPYYHTFILVMNIIFNIYTLMLSKKK